MNNDQVHINVEEYNKLIIHYDQTVKQDKYLSIDINRGFSVYYTNDEIVKEIKDALEHEIDLLKNTNADLKKTISELDQQVFKLNDEIRIVRGANAKLAPNKTTGDYTADEKNFRTMSIIDFILWKLLKNK